MFMPFHLFISSLIVKMLNNKKEPKTVSKSQVIGSASLRLAL
jgi:hypothetical protein